MAVVPDRLSGCQKKREEAISSRWVRQEGMGWDGSRRCRWAQNREQNTQDKIPEQRRAMPYSFGKHAGKNVEGKCVILSTSTSVTKNTFDHPSVSQEDIFEIAYLDSCLQIFRLSTFLPGKKKNKERKVYLKNWNFLWEHRTFNQKSLCKNLHWHFPASQGQDILSVFSKGLFPFCCFFFLHFIFLFWNNVSLIFNACSITNSRTVQKILMLEWGILIVLMENVLPTFEVALVPLEAVQTFFIMFWFGTNFSNSDKFQNHINSPPERKFSSCVSLLTSPADLQNVSSPELA